jgi:L-threonylcarbamoyladenylate synthase
MKTEFLDANEPQAIARAAALIGAGQIVAFPTDTLYGVGVNPFDAAAIERLYTVKGRSLAKGIPILLADEADLERVAVNVSPLARRLIAEYWPGPLTLILPKHPDLPANISPNDNIAARIPDHDVARALIRQAGGCVAASSANLSGQPGATTAVEAFTALEGMIAAALDGGPVQHGLSSTILDCTVDPPVVLRRGPLELETMMRSLAAEPVEAAPSTSSGGGVHPEAVCAA